MKLKLKSIKMKLIIMIIIIQQKKEIKKKY